MKAFSFNVTVAADSLDTEVVTELLRDAVAEGLPSGTLAHVKHDGVRNYSEQGYKVFRARVFGISAKAAGDAHNAKKPAQEPVEA